MKTLQLLFDNNRAWADRISSEQPGFFEQLSKQQSPDYLWIGCSDSRVPACSVLGLPPGGLFVHRNIANVVVSTDINCLSVIQFAVEALKVKHIIVCGHYGCGGVKAAMDSDTHGPIDHWLDHVREICRKHSDELDVIDDPGKRYDRLCELNVIEQVANVCSTSMVTEAWHSGQELHVHGWIYSLTDGLLKDLCVSAPNL